jgi:hypothetical protein
MQTLLKQSIIGGLSFLLLTGIAFSVGSSEPSVFEGEAVSTFTITPDATTTGNTATAYVSSPFTFTNSTVDFSINNWNPSTLQVRGNQSTVSANFTFHNTSVFLGYIRNIKVSYRAGTIVAANTYLATSTSEITTTPTSGYNSATAGTGFVQWNVSGYHRFFRIHLVNGGTSGTTNLTTSAAIEIQYISLNEGNAEIYSSNFLSSTAGKINCTSDTGWSTLQSDYNALSADAKTEFKTNTTNQTIVDARERYNYLIAFNNTLTDFVNAV